MKSVTFTTITQNEVKFEYKKVKFILAERKVGVFGLGRCVSLYQLDGVKKTWIKTIGWTKTDNHGGPSKEVILPGIVTFEAWKPPLSSMSNHYWINKFGNVIKSYYLYIQNAYEMPRLNKVTEKVFAEIAETPKKKGQYTTFLDIDKIMGLEESDKLRGFKEMYDELTQETKGTLSTLVALEEIIIQMRCTEVVESELRLSLSRNYIYARSIFYRRGNQINDIRVVIGTTDQYPDPLDVLLKDDSFRHVCYTYLLAAMNKTEANIVKLKALMKV